MCYFTSFFLFYPTGVATAENRFAAHSYPILSRILSYRTSALRLCLGTVMSKGWPNSTVLVELPACLEWRSRK